jgi:integrase/recombinase XerD
MPRTAILRPKLRESRGAKGLAAWVVNVPPNLSPTGKRQQLFFPTKTAASVECEKLKARKDNFGLSLNGMTLSKIAEASEAYKLLEPLGINLIHAVRDHVRRHEEKSASRPWGAVFAEYMGMPKKRSAKYEKDLWEAQETTRPLNDKLISEITTQDVEKALSQFAPSTRNAKLRILRAVFNLGCKRRYLAENPVERMDFAELESGEVEVFTVNETNALLQASIETDLALLPYFVLGFFCGIRPEGELGKLDWSDVNLTDRVIEIRPSVSKTGRRRFVDISENAASWLEIYRHRGGIMTGRAVPFGKSLSTARRRVVQDKTVDNMAQGKVKVSKWIQQGMRHSYCSYWLAKYKDVNKLVLQSGHTDAHTMWEYYHRGVTEAEAEKFWSITPSSDLANVVAFQNQT